MKKDDDSPKPKRARRVQGGSITLTRRDAETLAAALLDPPSPNAALKKAYRNLKALTKKA